MSRSTPINALRRDEVQDQQTKDMVEGIVNELEYTGGRGGLPGGFPGNEGQFEGMNGQMGPPQMMDYGMPPEGGMYPSPEFSGANMLPPGDPRSGGNFPGEGQYSQPPMQGPPHHTQSYQDPQQGGQSGQGVQGGFMENMTNLLAANSKEPMIAAVLYLVMSTDTVSSLLSKYIPYAASPMLGLLIRAILVAALFFIAKIFVLKR